MTCEIVDWILEEKKDINGKPDEIWVKSVVLAVKDTVGTAGDIWIWTL